MEILLAILLGAGFGFVLERAQASDPDKIIGMLTLRDLHLMKAIFFAIGLSSLLLFAGIGIGFISISHLSIKAMYPGVLLGGALLGLGWALAGFCPGTGIVAAGRGRKDAWIFLLGGLVGAWIFTLQYSFLEKIGLFNPWWGGKTTLVDTGAKGATALLEGKGSLLLALALGAVMLVIAKLLPLRPGQK
ncbi:YeeE/YedE thiosulfate transporter family protein [Kiritimatiellota bacterium B12222]|nr:YeeE/YedE thiosulfate transporter family protein [Kiritimatiellota bacterium B12222]